MDSLLTRMMTSGLLRARSAKATRDFCPPIYKANDTVAQGFQNYSEVAAELIQ